MDDIQIKVKVLEINGRLLEYEQLLAEPKVLEG